MSIGIAGCEYLPLTYAFGFATKNGVALSLMTAYMEAADNSFRMLQQLALGFPLSWFDWLAAALLILAVMFQGFYHYQRQKISKGPEQDRLVLTKENIPYVMASILTITIVTALSASLLGGYVGQTYVLATLATGMYMQSVPIHI